MAFGSHEQLGVGTLLRVARKAADLSQRALARKAGVSASTVARLESSRDANPSWSTMTRLLAAANFRVTIVAAAEAEPVQPVWHEHLRDRGGRHYPAHLRLVKVCDPHYDWSQGARYMSWLKPPAPEYSYWRRPRPRMPVHLARLKQSRHFKGRCHCARMARQRHPPEWRRPP